MPVPSFLLSAASAAIVTLTLQADPALGEEPLRFPARLTTIDDADLDVERMAERATVVVITLKAHWCPVCQRQLVRIAARDAELADCGVSFIVLAPGPKEELTAIRERTGFDHPFVEDEGLRIATSLGLKLSDGEITPAIVMLNADLTVGWMQTGRSSRYYGDQALVDKVACWQRTPI